MWERGRRLEWPLSFLDLVKVPVHLGLQTLRLWGGREEPRQRGFGRWDAAERRKPGSKAHEGPGAPPYSLLPALPSTDLICVNSLLVSEITLLLVYVHGSEE